MLKHLANYLTPSCVCLVGYSAQTPCKLFNFQLCPLGRIYPIKSDIFIRFQRLGSQARLDISDPVSDISDQPDLSGLHRVPEPWQLSWSDQGWDMSDLLDLFEPRRIPVPCHPSDRIYPSPIGYI
jgi:hypothetical protein